jgi:hypothetical protein
MDDLDRPDASARMRRTALGSGGPVGGPLKGNERVQAVGLVHEPSA